MAKYVDGFVITVPKNRLGEYRKMARVAGKVWKEHGALEYMETVGEDMNPPFDMKRMAYGGFKTIVEQ